MERLKFDLSGRLLSVDDKNLDDFPVNLDKKDLKTSESLGFFTRDDDEVKLESIFERNFWNLNDANGEIEPLKFSNGKTQEDIVEEISKLITNGEKIIFLHGACGTGKSAIALNLARVLGKISIVVPVKALQRQYEEDYLKNKYIIGLNGKKMKISMLTGRDNHDSLYKKGISCADPFLPENIKFTEKNAKKLLEYYQENPFIQNKIIRDYKSLRRLSIAPSNPYWSPILPKSFEVQQLRDAEKHVYRGVDGQEYVFYHRKKGCSYYDQYLSYLNSEIIIFNSAKYLAEISIGRKPKTEVDVIDEADEFLDNLFQQDELNLSRLNGALKSLIPEHESAEYVRKKIIELIELEEQNKRATGVDENNVYPIQETKIKEILELFTKNPELEVEIQIDELSYANKALESAMNFKDNMDEVYLTYRKSEDSLYVRLVSTNLSSKFKDLMRKTKTLVFMSGTLHSESVIKNIFGIKNYKIVEAETLNQGSLEIVKTGKEFDCKYSNLNSERYSREDYLKSLNAALDKAEVPMLIHVNAFQDLPNEYEKNSFDLDIISSEKLRKLQEEDKTGKAVSLFKEGLSSSLFSTKCSRGVDFPGDMCKSIIFTKYPNPPVKDTFWKILQKTHPEHYWEFYRDKARREFLQRIYRAVRSINDHVYVLSPDLRVLDAVRVLQEKNGEHKV